MSEFCNRHWIGKKPGKQIEEIENCFTVSKAAFYTTKIKHFFTQGPVMCCLSVKFQRR